MSLKKIFASIEKKQRKGQALPETLLLNAEDFCELLRKAGKTEEEIAQFLKEAELRLATPDNE